jgi:hypothetical protein
MQKQPRVIRPHTHGNQHAGEDGAARRARALRSTSSQKLSRRRELQHFLDSLPLVVGAALRRIKGADLRPLVQWRLYVEIPRITVPRDHRRRQQVPA